MVRKVATRYLDKQAEQIAVWLQREWAEGGPPNSVKSLARDLRRAAEHVCKHGKK